MVSFATLTGAARTAVGPDLAPFFTDDEGDAAALAAAAGQVADPVWRLPFHAPYEAMIEPGIADLDNAPAGGMAGAITRRPVPAPLRQPALPAFRHLRLAAHGRPRPPERRRGTGRAGALRRAAGPAGAVGVDRRLTPANGRVAALWLAGQVEADLYVPPVPVRAIRPVVDIRRQPGGPRERQVLFGATLNRFEEREGWAFVQADRGGYVGYVAAETLGTPLTATHHVATPATHIYAEDSLKSPDIAWLPFGAEVTVVHEAKQFFQTPDGFIPKKHLWPVAKRFNRSGDGGATVVRRALSVGRQLDPRHRLFRAGAGRAQRLWP